MSDTAHIILMLATGAFIGWTSRKVCCWDEWIAGFRCGAKAERDRKGESVVPTCEPILQPIENVPTAVPAGYVRVTGMYFARLKRWRLCDTADPGDTHFIDVRVPDLEELL